MEDILNKKFVSITEDLKKFMQKIETRCKDFESRSPKPTFEEQVEFINSQKSAFNQIDKFFYRLWLIAKNFSKKEYLMHKEFFQKELLYYFMRDTSPLNKQIYTKPLGYAGDYVVMNYLYEDNYPGEDTYGKFIDRYTLSVPLARAHIYRRFYFKKAILETIKKHIDENAIKISSFACGPAVEILDVIKSFNIPDKVYFYCIDGEKLAIEQIRRNISEIENIKKKKINIILLNQNILDLVRKKFFLSELKSQHLIYCAGFLDYLSDKISFLLIKYLFDLLKEGGLLICVNVYKKHPCRVYLEFLGDWYLHHRGKEDMIRLAEGIPYRKKIKIEFDPLTRTNIYLKIWKLKND